MFYATKVQSVGNGYIIDQRGSKLQAIGYLPVKSGDTVYTDGRVVFGNIPPKNAPAVIFDNPGGIPVLCEEDTQSETEKELRGYFKKNGKYKNYNIKGDEWIVNAKKTYKHEDENFIADEKIIDAEIAVDENNNEVGLYTVVKNIEIDPLETSDDSQSEVLFYYYTTKSTSPWGYHKSYQMGENLNPYGTYYYGDGFTSEISALWTIREPLYNIDYIRDDETILRECEIIIRKNGTEFQRLKMSELAKSIEDEVKKTTQIELPHYDEIERSIVPTDHIKSRAILINFKIKSDGSWEMLMEIEIGTERDFKAPEGRPASYPDSYDERWWCDSIATATLQLIKIDSADKVETIANYSKFFPLFMVRLISSQTIRIEAESYPPFEPDTKEFPYKQTYWVAFSTGTDLDPTTEDGYVDYIEYYTWNSKNMPDAPDYSNGIEEIADDFIFTVQDDYQAKYKNSAPQAVTGKGKIDYWQVENILDKGRKTIISGSKFLGTNYSNIDNAHLLNLSLAPLKGDSYLFAIRSDDDREIDGKLYKVDKDGNFQLVGNGLKNFRLRELKRISKATK